MRGLFKKPQTDSLAVAALISNKLQQMAAAAHLPMRLTDQLMDSKQLHTCQGPQSSSHAQQLNLQLLLHVHIDWAGSERRVQPHVQPELHRDSLLLQPSKTPEQHVHTDLPGSGLGAQHG